ncbi:MAG TPA: ABC transporter permease, partial [Chlorobaculum parvum]|nr:ABC transporter permease [Chlorobaculum parvum]
MNAGFWIASRYSFARKRFRVINIISGISLAGIVVGVSTLLIVMSVLNGFQNLARELFVTVESPVQLVAASGRSMVVSDSLLAAIGKLKGVQEVDPFLEGQAILSASAKSELVMVKGVTLEAQRRMQTGAGVRPPRFSGEGVSVGSLLAWRL